MDHIGITGGITVDAQPVLKHILKSKKNGERKKKANMTYSFEQFIEKAKIVHNNKYSYDNCVFKGFSQKLEIICSIHGSFWKTPTHHLIGRGCEKCGRSKIGLKIKSNTQKFIEKAKKIHGDFYSYEFVKYTNAITKIIVMCKIHGCFECTPHIHLGGHGCYKCFLERRTGSMEQFITEANVVHNNKYTYENVTYKNIRIKVSITCPLHGDFKQTPDSHLHGHGCPKCIKTYKQNKWLNYLGLPDDKLHREVTIKIGNKKFRVDGYSPELKTVYEFNGDSWHGNPKIFDANSINPVTKKTYGVLYKNTIQKETSLKEAGFQVISIWESDFDSFDRNRYQVNKFQPKED